MQIASLEVDRSLDTDILLVTIMHACEHEISSIQATEAKEKEKKKRKTCIDHSCDLIGRVSSSTVLEPQQISAKLASGAASNSEPVNGS